ncbi:high-potential iron-sulfur protein [Halosolutus gelatinilyticus]|uniref:high-potential iron-sulfur protein n=1 Tax=Halosolutus gelatinilyticus TaxID=2931975 RepID=UPI001FF1FD7E|nr:high-potential iron-sulfur protein [Halosolutus gelatinilyticus]
MEDGKPHESRRRFLRLTGCGSLIGLAGCMNLNENAAGPASQPREGLPADWCLDDLSDSVPESEANAVSIDGVERKPEGELLSKQDAAYQCGPSDGQQCGNCTFFIDDRSGNGWGACTEVAGEIRSVDWCGLWAPRMEIQEGQSEGGTAGDESADEEEGGGGNESDGGNESEGGNESGGEDNQSDGGGGDGGGSDGGNESDGGN